MSAMSANVLRLCWMLYFHFVFGLALILLGMVTIYSRFSTRLRPWHPVLGSVYFYGGE